MNNKLIARSALLLTLVAALVVLQATAAEGHAAQRPGSAQEKATTSAVPSLRGLRDFGLTNMQPAVVGTADRTVSQPVATAGRSGFDWRDAGVGAAAMLALVLIVAGTGAGLALRGQRRAFRSA